MACSQRAKCFIASYLHNDSGLSKGETYDKTTCPQGSIDLASSHSSLAFDLIKSKLSEPECLKLAEEDTLYGEDAGIQSLRVALANLVTSHTTPPSPINTDNIVVLNGICPVITALGFCLGDPGDGFLLPTPCYKSFGASLEFSGIVVCPAHMSSQSSEDGVQFDLTVDVLEAGLKEANKKGINVRALVITNPGNPIGRIHSEKQMKEYFEFARRNALHVIVDEAYLFAVFGEEAEVKSVISMDNFPLRKELIHVIWGFGKGFGMAGLDCGFLHTYNKEVLKVLRSGIIDSTSTSIQNMLTYFMKDTRWLDEIFFPTHNARLRECYSVVKAQLVELSIPFVECTAGYSVLADLRKYMKGDDKESELALWKRLLSEGKVQISPGSELFHNEYGWFRIVFTRDLDTLKTGLERMKAVLLSSVSRNEQSPGECVDTAVEDCVPAADCLEDLVRTLSTQIRASDWLLDNTADQWVKEHPDIAHVFLDKE